MKDNIDMAIESLEIAVGYVALVADGVGNMPILKDRAKADATILTEGINALTAMRKAKEVDGEYFRIINALNAKKKSLTTSEFRDKELADLGASCYDAMNRIDYLTALREAKEVDVEGLGDDIPHGLYKIFWMEGGSSLASVGNTYSGKRWFAPTNWTTDSNNNPLVASTDWTRVERVERIDSLTTPDTIAKRDVPEGYALVPIEPTEEMYQASRTEDFMTGDQFCEAYKAMIKAALADEGGGRMTYTYKELWEYLAAAQPHDYERMYDVLMEVLEKLSEQGDKNDR